MPSLRADPALHMPPASTTVAGAESQPAHLRATTARRPHAPFSTTMSVTSAFSTTRAPRWRGALGVGLRRVDRVGLAVVGCPQAADHVLAVEQRVLGQDVRRRQELDLDAEGAAHRAGALELLEARLATAPPPPSRSA